MFSGAAGLVLAALPYSVAILAQGSLSGLLLIPSAGFVLFWLLLLVSLVEIGVMTAALARLVSGLNHIFLYLVAAAYVGFAGVYALFYALLVPDVHGIQILAALSIVRWFTLLAVHPVSQTK